MTTEYMYYFSLITLAIIAQRYTGVWIIKRGYTQVFEYNPRRGFEGWRQPCLADKSEVWPGKLRPKSITSNETKETIRTDDGERGNIDRKIRGREPYFSFNEFSFNMLSVPKASKQV